MLNAVKADEQLYLFVKIALQTGARANTLINIQKKDIVSYIQLISATFRKLRIKG